MKKLVIFLIGFWLLTVSFASAEGFITRKPVIKEHKSFITRKPVIREHKPFIDRHLEPETRHQIFRIHADGGTVVDYHWMNKVIKKLKAQGLYSSCKGLWDANFAYKNATGVTTLYDISGNNNDVIQATGANQPVWTANQQNGRAGLVFDISDTLMISNTIIGTGNPAVTFIGVIKTGTLAADRCWFATGSNSAAKNAHRMLVTTDGKFYWANLFNDRATAASTLLASTNYILFATHAAVVFSADDPKFYKNGDNVVSSEGAGTESPNLIDNVTAIGTDEISAEPWIGSIYGVMVFNVVLTDVQRQELEGLLNTYYAIY